MRLTNGRDSPWGHKYPSVEPETRLVPRGPPPDTWALGCRDVMVRINEDLSGLDNVELELAAEWLWHLGRQFVGEPGTSPIPGNQWWPVQLGLDSKPCRHLSFHWKAMKTVRSALLLPACSFLLLPLSLAISSLALDATYWEETIFLLSISCSQELVRFNFLNNTTFPHLNRCSLMW